jgi:hypothetical protein
MEAVIELDMAPVRRVDVFDSRSSRHLSGPSRLIIATTGKTLGNGDLCLRQQQWLISGWRC